MLAVVTLDPLAEEGTKFLAAVKRWNLMEGHRIEAVLPMTATDLEDYLCHGTPDALGAEIQRLFDGHNSHIAEGGDTRPEELDRENLPHLDQVLVRLGLGEVVDDS